jgi:glycogen debranching enzyme
LSYFSNAEIKTNKMTHRKGCIEVEIIIKGTGVRSIVLDIANDTSQVSEQLPFEQLLQKNLVTWQDWFASVPAVDSIWNEAYSYAWWNMANNLINPQGFVRYEAMMPSKTKYVGLWLWDCAMHAIAFRHIDPELARNQIRVMLACQLPDGMLPDAIFDEGIISEITHPIAARVTKPPILAWAALKIHDIAPDLAFIKEIYPALVRWNAWWFEENDDDSDGIVQYNHPYSSGLDDNPLWDYGMPVESPDINTYLCIQMDSLAVMADLLGFPVEAAEWRSKADELVEKMINHFWDGEAGIFRSLVNHLPVPVVTPFNLYPIWTGRLPEKILKRCLATLTDSKKFWGVHSLPSVSYDDPHFTQETMWRGPVWVNINYFFIEALEKVGEMTLARELRNKTLQLIKEKPGMFEYYNAISGEPPEKAARVFGWTAAVFIDLTIAANKENI